MHGNRFPPAASLALLLAAPLGTVAVAAHSAEYLSVRQAQQLMYPTATRFVEQPKEQVRAWKARAAAQDERIRTLRVKVWEARMGDVVLGWFVTDAVIGKFEHVDYAMAVDGDGTVRRVEVLVYRESHGFEVAQRDWLAQFEGKSAASTPLALARDIRNISGATLSCGHLADGVRRVSQLLASVRAAP